MNPVNPLLHGGKIDDMDGVEFHDLMASGGCVCGHPQPDHLYGDYYDASGVKRKHQGECGQCGCQSYG